MLVYAQIVEFPAPTALSMAALLLAFFGLLGAAVWLDTRRKRALRAAGRTSQWAAVDRILKERRLNAEERSVLREMLRRHANDTPLEALTSRFAFERLVDAAMRQASSRMDDAALKRFGTVLRDIRVQLGLEATAIGQQIQSTRELDGGQRMDVSWEGAAKWVQLHVDDVDEAYFYLRYRGEPPAPALPGAGERVKCSLWRDEDGRYTFTADVVGTERTPPRMTLAHTAALKRTQSREHFRVRHDQSTSVAILSPARGDALETVAGQPPVTRVRGRITSLSAGGCALVVQDAIGNRMILRMTLELDDEAPIEVHGAIVSSMPISGGRHLLRLKFVHLPEESADAISRHVMRRQQQLLAARQNRDTA